MSNRKTKNYTRSPLLVNLKFEEEKTKLTHSSLYQNEQGTETPLEPPCPLCPHYIFRFHFSWFQNNAYYIYREHIFNSLQNGSTLAVWY